jgi:hypothetical protein
MSARHADRGRTSDLEQLGFLVLDELVDDRHVLVRRVVELLLGAAAVVLAGLAVLDQLSSCSLALRRTLRMAPGPPPPCRARP